MTSNPIRATSYSLESVVLSSPRLDDDIEISNITAEINLYESLFLPYISGNIIIGDTSNLMSLVNFNGQERIRIRVSVNPDSAIEREFIVYSVQYQGKAANDHASVISLSIIEEHGYFSNFKRLSWAYGGNASTIIKTVLQDELGLSINDKLANFDSAEEPLQSFEFVVPNWSPLKFTDALVKRATTTRGEPYFLFSSLKDGVLLRSLSEMLTSTPTNMHEPYKYTQVHSTVDVFEEKRVIYTVNFPESDNSIKLAKDGALGMTMFNVDPFDPSKTTSGDFRFVDHFARKQAEGTILNKYTPYDENFTIGPDSSSLHELNSAYYSEVNPSLSFGSKKAFGEEEDIAKHLHKVRRQSDVSIMEKERYEITIPGLTMLEQDSNTSIGKVINILMTSNLPLISDTPTEDVLDSKRGSLGSLFLITRCRHRFGVDNQYVASLEITRTDRNQEL